jgi:hypothetical protein
LIHCRRNCNGNGTTGHWATEARATGATGGNDNGNSDQSIIAIAIDCVCVDVWMWGTPTRSTFIPCFIRKREKKNSILKLPTKE